ncbi:MAG TPA: alkaline phosphatase [Bryobacteraceae bacterium]|nr:alkaline phosphatase [Bryobacteraceae bacterium]
MKRTLLAIFILSLAVHAAERRAKNVILFIGDAGGVPTLHAASLYGHKDPQKLYIQNMPHIALVDTSPADAWVTDSAAGMTAIVTGQKTNNGVISQSASAVKGQTDGETLETLLEFAEQHGLSTGVLSNMSMVDATPAACYAHSNDRGKAGEIFAQILSPRAGDGVDLVIGAGRKQILAATEKMGLNIADALSKKGYAFYDSPGAIQPNDRRVVALFDSGDYEAWPAVERAISILSRNNKGYFLMVEWDMHTTNTKRGLDRVLEMDDVIRKVAGTVKNDTLLLFAADHSFDLRVRGGRKGDVLIPEPGEAKPKIRVDNGHTGEQVLAAAQGPGAERVHGFIRNTDLFQIMMAAYGWTKPAVSFATGR